VFTIRERNSTNSGRGIEEITSIGTLFRTLHKLRAKFAMADTGNTTIITEESQQDPTSQVSQYTDTIDDLLKEYLGLLEQYSNEQARLQSGQQQVKHPFMAS
jgi:hypothetical protein